MCVLTNEEYKAYQMGFTFCRLGHAPGVGLSGAVGAPRGSKLFYFKHGQLAYQIDRDDEQDRMQGKFSPYGRTGDLGVGSNMIKF